MARPNIKKILVAFASALRDAEAHDEYSLLIKLAEAVAPAGPLLDSVDNKLQITQVTGSGVLTRRAWSLTKCLIDVLQLSAAKKDVLADLGRLAQFLEAHATMPFDNILQAIAPPPLAVIVKRLEKSLDSEEFAQQVKALAADSGNDTSFLLDLAISLDLKLAARTPRKKVVDGLLALNRDMITFGLKQQAMSGRSAA